MSDGRILVTGAGGFIGSHLAETLLHHGYHVRALVRYNGRSDWGWLEQVAPNAGARLEVVAGDVCDPFGMHTVMRGCDRVFHLAALIGIPYSYHSPANYVAVNVQGTLNVLQAARDLEVSRVICTSTSEVYGTALQTPITEEHPLQAQSPYSATKIGADQLALSFHRSFGLPVTLCRPFNTYGPRQSARAIIPTILTQFLSGSPRVRVGALHPRREFNFVSDTVDGFLALAASDQTVGEVVNIGCGYDVSIGELIALISEIFGREVEVEQERSRLRPAASEVTLLQASHAKATALTGWIPKYGGREGLKGGLTRTIEWLRDPVNLSRYKTESYIV